MKIASALAHLVVLPGLVLACAAAMASPQIAAKAGCVACHAADKKMIGPSWHDIAAKYKGQADAAARLSMAVRKGGSGVWGKVPMPPTEPGTLNDADLKAVITWVLKTP
jgi:cytochrome c